MPREFTEQFLSQFSADSLPADLLDRTQAGFPEHKSAEFWDGALWALVHFGAVSDARLPLLTQLRGFQLAVALTYKAALESDWPIEV